MNKRFVNTYNFSELSSEYKNIALQSLEKRASENFRDFVEPELSNMFMQDLKNIGLFIEEIYPNERASVNHKQNVLSSGTLQYTMVDTNIVKNRLYNFDIADYLTNLFINARNLFDRLYDIVYHYLPEEQSEELNINDLEIDFSNSILQNIYIDGNNMTGCMDTDKIFQDIQYKEFCTDFNNFLKQISSLYSDILQEHYVDCISESNLIAYAEEYGIQFLQSGKIAVFNDVIVI